MKDRPILFSGEMVRAILDGRKTQTRRLVTSIAGHREFVTGQNKIISAQELLTASGNQWMANETTCPYGKPGDRLWVRESAYIAPPNFGDDVFCNMKDSQGRPRNVGWAASMDSDSVRCATDYRVKCTPSIFMPRWASRLTLEITGVRVERLRQITVIDALAEGVKTMGEFIELWDRINGKRATYDSNPFVWVIEFRRVEANVPPPARVDPGTSEAARARL